MPHGAELLLSAGQSDAGNYGGRVFSERSGPRAQWKNLGSAGGRLLGPLLFLLGERLRVLLFLLDSLLIPLGWA